ncbi:MAG: hypothetical protein LBP89_10310 [Helicobacteraceae bacterium]|jgi:hypothetical protein|nr:hypothetical protein [Helicobacteraceae bacterium]
MAKKYKSWREMGKTPVNTGALESKMYRNETTRNIALFYGTSANFARAHDLHPCVIAEVVRRRCSGLYPPIQSAQSPENPY